ncbi:MAG: hypothetical protein JWM98_1211 [Thermoleophilia bacterium]|nr:hypothetical protein [Thermoleophilia bacterium]
MVDPARQLGAIAKLALLDEGARVPALAAEARCPYAAMVADIGTGAVAPPVHEFGEAAADPAALRSARAEAHHALGAIFGAPAHDLVQALRDMRETPLDELPRAGTAPAVHTYGEPPAHRWAELRESLAGDADDFEPVAQVMQSHQQVPGAGWIRGMDLWAPIGEHGEPMARALVEAGRVMDAVVLDRMAPDLAALTEQHAATLGVWTFRRDALRSMVEGVGTFTGATALLVQRRVPGLDGMQLLEAIERDQLLTRLSKAPLAAAGPMFFDGFVPTVSVELPQSGRLALAEPYDRILRATRLARADEQAQAGAKLIQTRRGCPIGVRGIEVETAAGTHVNEETYIQTLGREYLHLAKRFYARELERTPT